jgi:hypothetical protein
MDSPDRVGRETESRYGIASGIQAAVARNRPVSQIVHDNALLTAPSNTDKYILNHAQHAI